jgi:hypothetical protein
VENPPPLQAVVRGQCSSRWATVEAMEYRRVRFAAFPRVEPEPHLLDDEQPNPAVRAIVLLRSEFGWSVREAAGYLNRVIAGEPIDLDITDANASRFVAELRALGGVVDE